MPKISAKFNRSHPLLGRQMQVGWVKIGDFRQIAGYILTRSSAIAELSQSDRAIRLVSSNIANYHATVQKLLIRQVLTKSMV